MFLVDVHSGGGRVGWLEYQGSAYAVTAPDWTELLPAGAPSGQAGLLYQGIHRVPRRIDLVDEGQGWGVRETLEC